jgi:hypothetical protein
MTQSSAIALSPTDNTLIQPISVPTESKVIGGLLQPYKQVSIQVELGHCSYLFIRLLNDAK